VHERRRRHIRVQLLRIGQGALEIFSRLESEAADCDAWFEDYDDSYAVVVPEKHAPLMGGPLERPVGRRPGRRAPVMTEAELSTRPGLGAVGLAVGLPLATTTLQVPSSYTFSPRFPGCAVGHPQQHLRATLAYCGLP